VAVVGPLNHGQFRRRRRARRRHRRRGSSALWGRIALTWC
jgi:hypothetical protein